MYQNLVTTPEAAVTHLFFHCCLRDGEYTTDELSVLSEKLVKTGVNARLNFKNEMENYKSYYPTIENDDSYLTHLMNLIQPLKTLAIFSYCVELCLSDLRFVPEEKSLLNKIGNALGIEERHQDICKTIFLQRKTVENQHLF